MPDMAITQSAPLAVVDAARRAFRRGDDHRYVVAAVNWIAHVEPRLAPGFAADPVVLAAHTAMWGLDAVYYAGLQRLFALLRIHD